MCAEIYSALRAHEIPVLLPIVPIFQMSGALEPCAWQLHTKIRSDRLAFCAPTISVYKNFRSLEGLALVPLGAEAYTKFRWVAKILRLGHRVHEIPV